MKRKTISKRLRFEVFKRDSFTCQYCGRKSPDVILQCDHIEPVANGGATDILNLITSCFDCNNGKGAIALSDSAALTKQTDQLAELQERREQIEMMIEWRNGLANLDDQVLDRIAEAWVKICENSCSVTSIGKDVLRKNIKRYGVDLVMRAMHESAMSYFKRGDDDKFTQESMGKAFDSIGPVANVLRQSVDKPFLREFFYIRGILRNRLSYVNERDVIAMMDDAVSGGADIDDIRHQAKSVRNWTQFEAWLSQYWPDVE